nr:hypothetical protein JVH1_3939 [Rhodococcus sp. JVH1]
MRATANGIACGAENPTAHVDEMTSARPERDLDVGCGEGADAIQLALSAPWALPDRRPGGPPTADPRLRQHKLTPLYVSDARG